MDISFQDIRTEKQLHSVDGFSNRKHRPDFTYSKDGKTFCVEVELSLKNKKRLEQNRTIYPTIEILELRKMKEAFGHG